MRMRNHHRSTIIDHRRSIVSFIGTDDSCSMIRMTPPSSLGAFFRIIVFACCLFERCRVCVVFFFFGSSILVLSSIITPFLAISCSTKAFIPPSSSSFRS